MPKPYNKYQVQTFGVRPSLLQIANPNSNLSLRTISPVLLLLLLLDSFGLCLRGSKQSKPRTFQRKKVQLRNFALPLFVWCRRPSSAFHTPSVFSARATDIFVGYRSSSSTISFLCDHPSCLGQQSSPPVATIPRVWICP